MSFCALGGKQCSRNSAKSNERRSLRSSAASPSPTPPRKSLPLRNCIMCERYRARRISSSSSSPSSSVECRLRNDLGRKWSIRSPRQTNARINFYSSVGASLSLPRAPLHVRIYGLGRSSFFPIRNIAFHPLFSLPTCATATFKSTERERGSTADTM